ncbi:MAG: ABC transporter permease [Eubacteriales bacterium]
MSTTTHNSDPLVRISKRDSISTGKSISIRLIAIAIALVVCGILIYALVEMNPLKVYAAMFEGAFGSTRKSWITIRDTMFLLCIGIGLAPAFKMRFWNIGAEGQVLVGGMATAFCMINYPTLPTFLLFAVMIISSIIGGAIWGFIPAIFKSRFGTNETLFTLMMNYIAIQLTAFAVSKWEGTPGSNSVGVINMQGQAGWFPSFLGQQYMVNLLLVIVLAVGMFIYLKSSKQGYEITVVGSSENTARYAGISVAKVTLRTMAISGAICGFAGFLAVSGSSHTISVNTAGGNGFTAIIVAWLAKFNTFVMLLIAVFLAFLEKGAIEIASQYDLNEYAADIISGIILFFILGSEFFINYQLHFRKASKKGAEV